MRPRTLDDLDRDLIDALTTGDTDAIAAAGAAIDTWQTRHRTPAAGLAQAALWYALHGLRVHPLRSRAKVPLTAHGCKDASSDEAQIRDWWTRWPEANIGIATGHLVDVIDIDGHPGQVSRAQRYDRLDQITLGIVSTPRPGGTHLYAAAQPGRRNGAAIAPGIDTRGAGGYVVAPPSWVDTGDYAGPYVWTRPLRLPEAEAVA